MEDKDENGISSLISLSVIDTAVSIERKRKAFSINVISMNLKAIIVSRKMVKISFMYIHTNFVLILYYNI